MLDVACFLRLWHVDGTMRGGFWLGLVLVFAMVLGSGCEGHKPKFWIYTSIYKEVIREIEGPLKQAFPDVDIRWFQAGSETIASRLGAEFVAGKPRADLILTSDPFWYEELKQEGYLLPHHSASTSYLPPAYVDPSGAFATVRLPVMVIGVHSGRVAESEFPTSWKDLLNPKWKGKVSMPNPIESGSAFTSVALLANALGWEYFKSLRENDVLAAGGNSSVVTRIETGERPVGILLLENILKVKKKGSKIRPVYPKEGVIPVESPIAILKTTRNPELAHKVVDWFFGPIAQKAIVSGFMYSFHPEAGTPTGALSVKDLQLGLPKTKEGIPWSASILSELFSKRDEIKSKFSELVLN